MSRANTNSRDSEVQRQRRMAGYDRIRAELGKPQPTEYERKLRRITNERYRTKVANRAAAQQEKAA